MFTDFYHGIIKKTVVSFGTLFNNIHITREIPNGVSQRIKVPLTYSVKEKFINRLNVSLADLSNQAVQITLPRMSFAITGMTYDAERKKNSINRRYRETVGTDVNIEFSYHHMPVPYDLDMTLSCYVRNMDDGLQIVEQIVPYFTPEFSITIKPDVLGDASEKLDIPIVLTQVTTEEAFEGPLVSENNRFIMWDLTFTAKINLYGPVKDHNLINYIQSNIIDIENDQP